MNIYLLRHAEAAHAPEGTPDMERKLTPAGEKTIRDMLPGVEKLIGQVEFVLTSPAARAARTAELLAEYFRCAAFVETLDALAGPGAEQDVCVMLNKLVGKDVVVLVGHTPHLGNLAKYLAGDESEEEIKIKKAGMAKISVAVRVGTRSSRAAAGVPGRGEYGKTWTREKAICRARLAVRWNCSSVSPGKATMMSVVMAASGQAERTRATSRAKLSRV